MRLLALLVLILGIAVLVFGIMFIPQASNAKDEVTQSLQAPVTLDNLDSTYDAIDGQLKQVPQTDPSYLTLFARRTSLGLARANVGTAKLVNTMGIVNIIAGAGLIFAGCALWMRKAQNA